MDNIWYNIPEQTKRNAYIQVSEEIGMAPFAVEKDWWVTQILSAIFEMETGKHLIFKGGTSLSKAWGIIERFSEDIDLAFDRTFLEFNGDQNRSQIKKLRKLTGKYMSEEFSPRLEKLLKEKGLSDISVNSIKQKASDADPAQVEIRYPNVMDYPGYIEPRVLLEISSSSLIEPFKVRSCSSLLDDYYFESEFAEAPIDIPSAIPERTFLEKIFLLHEEFQRSHDKIRVDRQSRHIYDVYQLIQTEYADAALANKELYKSIVKHRYAFFHLGGVDYNRHQPKTINPVPIPEFIDAWKVDYKKMQDEMIFGDSPSFDLMIKTLEDFTVKKINQLTWELGVVFD